MDCFEANSAIIKRHQYTSDVIAIVGNNIDNFTSSTIHKDI